MGDNIVTLRNTPVALDSDIGRAFVADATRAAEGLISDRELAEKYELSPADWQAITKDMMLARAIRAERERRVHKGTAAKEAAAKHFVKMPTILAGIAENAASNPRHVIEAAKEIRAVANGGEPQNASNQSERFVITINLGADADGKPVVEHYDKSIAIDVNDKPIAIGSTPPLTPEEIALRALMERD
jgi:hypothetical protein